MAHEKSEFSRNYLVNPSFESSIGNEWYPNFGQPDVSMQQIRQDPGVFYVHDGSQALRVFVSRGDKSGSIAQNVNLNVQYNRTYRFSIYVRNPRDTENPPDYPGYPSPDPFNASVKISTIGGLHGLPETSQPEHDVFAGTGWQQLSYDLYIKYHERYTGLIVEFYLGGHGGAQGSWADFDDARLELI